QSQSSAAQAAAAAAQITADAAKAAADATDARALLRPAIQYSTLDPYGVGNGGDTWIKRDANGLAMARWEWVGAGAPHNSSSSKKDSFGNVITNIFPAPSFEREGTPTVVRTNLIPDDSMTT